MTQQTQTPRRENSPPQTMSRARTRVERWGLGLVALVGSLPFLHTVTADPDLWWHVRTGQRIIADWAIPAVDDWSFTAAGRVWTNHEWLTDVLMAGAYDLAGSGGLLILRSALFLALVAGLVVAFSRRVRSPALVFVVVMVTVPVLAVFINVRAHSFTYTLVVWAVVVLDRVRAGHFGWLWALPVMMLFWVNLHGGFLLGLGFIGLSLLMLLFGFDEPVARPVGRERRMIITAGLATAAVTLINPFGPELYGYLAYELGANHSIVSEWQPVKGQQLIFFWVYLIVPVGLWVLARRWRRLTLLIMLAATAIQTWQQARFFVVMGLFGALVTVEALGTLIDQIRRDRGEASLLIRLLDPKAALVAIAAVAVVLGSTVGLAVARGQSGVTVDTELYPIAATEWLSAADVGPNLGLPLPWGGYAIWHLAPNTKVAIDGRNLTVYDDEWVDAYLRALRDGREPRLIDNTEADAWLLQADSNLIPTLVAGGAWHEAYRDPVAVVLLPLPTTVTEGPLPPSTARFP